jgi:8-oxo-dGTP pyrophosphatase MutT (NUDIX family)
MKKTATARVQCAALPFRISDGFGVEVMLVTSRQTKRWIIPKGWVKKRDDLWQSAAREARDEAGVTGVVGTEPIGSFSYDKRLRNGRTVPCEVQVFPLEVKLRQNKWPEKGQREISWFSPDEAADAVQETFPRDLIRDYFNSDSLGRQGHSWPYAWPGRGRR